MAQGGHAPVEGDGLTPELPRVRPLVVRSAWHGRTSFPPARTLPAKPIRVHRSGGTPSLFSRTSEPRTHTLPTRSTSATSAGAEGSGASPSFPHTRSWIPSPPDILSSVDASRPRLRRLPSRVGAVPPEPSEPSKPSSRLSRSSPSHEAGCRSLREARQADAVSDRDRQPRADSGRLKDRLSRRGRRRRPAGRIFCVAHSGSLSNASAVWLAGVVLAGRWRRDDAERSIPSFQRGPDDQRSWNHI